MKYGIIDLGSNTIRLAVYHVCHNLPVCLFSRKIFARAVSYKRHGIMSREGIHVITNALQELSWHASHHELASLWCFATACLRGLTNQSEVLIAIQTSTGLNVEVLTGQEEASFGVSGLTSSLSIRDAVSIDLGGGSCELTLIKEGATIHAISLDIGSVSASKDYVAGIFPNSDEIQAIIQHFNSALKEAAWLKNCGLITAYAMGGSARALCRMHRALYRPGASLGTYSLELNEIASLYKKLCAMQLDGVRLTDQHCPGRIFTLMPGIVMLREAMAYAGTHRFLLASAGVREGYLLNKLGMP